MKIAKIVGGGCLGLIVLFGAIFALVFYATSGITDTADDFFAAVKAGDYEEAQQYTSQRLREQNSPDDLRAFAEENGLTNIVDTSWASRSIKNNTGEVSGTVESESGGVIPMTILFVSEGDEWRIDGFDVQSPGLSGGQSRRPENAGSDRIDPEALAASKTGNLPTHMWLNEAWIEDDYLMFQSLWKEKPSQQSLAERYSPDGLSDDDIAALDDAAAELEIAEFNEQGQLVMGYVRNIPGRSVRTVFTYEDTGSGARSWKIVDLSIDKG